MRTIFGFLLSSNKIFSLKSIIYSTVVDWFYKGVKKPKAFLSFTVHIHSSNLWWSPYSNHQQRLAEIIADLRNDREMTFPRIADWLNDNGYKTPRRHTFTSSHAYSIYIKSKIRSDRYGKTFYSQLKDIKVTFH
jgi:hypothetical protein